MGCRNPEVEFIIAGSVGDLVYNEDSPPVAIGYDSPVLEDQADAVPFEMRVYVSQKEGNNDVGFNQISFYQCLPSFVTAGSSQEEFSTQEWSIAAVENPNYDVDESPAGTGKPVDGYLIVDEIPA